MGTLGPYELNSIITGDARGLAKDIPDESVDLIISDPPYGIGYASSRKTRRNGLPRKNVANFDQDILDTSFINDYVRILSFTGAMYIFTRWDVLPIWKRAVEESGGSVNQRLVWNKTHWGMGDLRYYGSQTEDILFCTKGFHHLRWAKREGNIWAANTYLLPEGQYDHPTQKPESIITKMIVNSSDPDDIILDLHCGSGTVAVCAKRLDRRFLCADIKQKYVDMSHQRVANTQPPLPIVYPEQLSLEVV